MSVTLRLQGLSKRAGSYDIRKFFTGLDIPEGGIHIIGGAAGEAFVDVATWDNAYQALQMSDLEIRNSKIQISVVSSEEKQQALENFRKSKYSTHGRNGTQEKKSNDRRDARTRKRHFYLQAVIIDFEPTHTDIRHFFDGLFIRDLLFSKDKESSENMVLIMFDNRADATEGYNRYKASKIIRMMWSSEEEWIKYGGSLDYDDDCISSTSANSRRKANSMSPRRRSRSPRRHSRSSRRNSRSPRKHSRSPRKRSRSPRKHSRSPQSFSRTPPSFSRSSASQSEEQDSKIPEEYHVLLKNLSYRAKRDDIKKLFHNHVRDDHIVFVFDKMGNRTREGFATFTNEQHFRKALMLNKVILKGHTLCISLISKSQMQKLLSSKGHTFQAYIYLRNFSPDVTKRDVKEFLVGFSVNEDDIFLLLNKSNACLGDVLVKLSSLEETVRAEKLDRTPFKDRRIPLKVVYENNLVSFLHSTGLHMKLPDMNECVTQEDDPSEDEVTKENDTRDDESITQEMDKPEDDTAVQKDRVPECVSQADD